MSRFYISVSKAKSKTKLLFFFFTIWTLCEKRETVEFTEKKINVKSLPGARTTIKFILKKLVKTI